MSKFLAFAFMGVAAATNASSNANGTSDASSDPGNTDGGNTDATQNAGVAAKFANNTEVPQTGAVMYMKATITLGSLPANQTAAHLTGYTVPAAGACSAKTTNEAAATICIVEEALTSVVSEVDADATAIVIDVSNTRRRSLTESSRRLGSSGALKFTTKVTASSVAAANGIAHAATQDSYKTKMESSITGLGTITAPKLTTADMSAVCGTDGCAAAAPAAYTPPATDSTTGTSSDAFKTTLGLAAAVVSGLFLF